MSRPTAGAAMGGGRAFVDATGTPVPLRGPVVRVVATDPRVGELLLELGAQLVGCAGTLDGVDGYETVCRDTLCLPLQLERSKLFGGDGTA